MHRGLLLGLHLLQLDRQRLIGRGQEPLWVGDSEHVEQIGVGRDALLRPEHFGVTHDQLLHCLSLRHALQSSDDVRIGRRHHVNAIIEIRRQNPLGFAIGRIRIAVVGQIVRDQLGDRAQLALQRSMEQGEDRDERLETLLDPRQLGADRNVLVVLAD